MPAPYSYNTENCIKRISVPSQGYLECLMSAYNAYAYVLVLAIDTNQFHSGKHIKQKNRLLINRI